ncbi:trigger factor [Gammaproteobacteria bacterium]|nr:trigger factor [Gammaproteobacteria bacterium]
MDVSVETIEGLETKLTITLPSEDVEQRLDAKLVDAKAKARIPGFRPGKVPLKEIRRRFEPSMRAELAGEMMQNSFYEAISQESLNPAGPPTLQVQKMEPNADLEFTATFELVPTVEVAELSKVEIKRPSTEITDEDINKMIERLKEQRISYELVERESRLDDQVVVDFEGKLDGEVVESAGGTDVTFIIGKGQMIEDFEKGAQGVSAGDTTSFQALFPENYRAEELQGKTLEFSLTMKQVKESKLPELNDEFYKEFGVEEGGEEAFRKEVLSNMEKELEAAVKNQLKQQVMDGLGELHEFSIPGPMVSREIQTLKDQMMGQFQQPPGGKQNDFNLPDELFKDQAEKRVKLGLVVNEIISKFEIEVDQEKLDQHLNDLASSYAEPEQVIGWYRGNPEQMQNLEMGVLEDQVVDHIISKAVVEEVVSDYDSVISGAAIAPEEVESSEEKNDDSARDSAAT